MAPHDHRCGHGPQQSPLTTRVVILKSGSSMQSPWQRMILSSSEGSGPHSRNGRAANEGMADPVGCWPRSRPRSSDRLRSRARWNPPERTLRPSIMSSWAMPCRHVLSPSTGRARWIGRWHPRGGPDATVSRMRGSGIQSIVNGPDDHLDEASTIVAGGWRTSLRPHMCSEVGAVDGDWGAPHLWKITSSRTWRMVDAVSSWRRRAMSCAVERASRALSDAFTLEVML